jgi:CHASE3 domain sensor protein
MLLIKLLWHNVQYRAQRVHDEETGAINTIELLVLVGVIVILVGVVIAALQTRVVDRAKTVPLG